MSDDLFEVLRGVLSNYDLVCLSGREDTMARLIMYEDLIMVINNREQSLSSDIDKTLSDHIVRSDDFEKIVEELTEKVSEFLRKRGTIPTKVPDKDEVTKVLDDVIRSFCGSSEDTEAMVESLTPYVMNMKSGCTRDINNMVDAKLSYPWSVEFEGIRGRLVGEVSLAIADYFDVTVPRLTIPKPETRARAFIPHFDRRSMKAIVRRVLPLESTKESDVFVGEMVSNMYENLPFILDSGMIGWEISAELLINGIKPTHIGVPQMVREIVSVVIMNACTPWTSDPNVRHERTKADIIDVLSAYGVEMDGFSEIKEVIASMILFNKNGEERPFKHMRDVMSSAIINVPGLNKKGYQGYVPHLVSGAYWVLYKVKTD